MFLEFYGLKEQPFGVTPDPRFICPSRTHSKAFNSLSRGLEAGCGFLALISRPGMGKTTLVFQLLNQLNQTSHAVFLFQTQCDSRELLRYVLSGLGLDAAGQDIVSMHERLNQVLARELLAGRRLVLIIDECQNLDNSVLETVRLLSDFETPQTKLMQIILVGQTQLAEKLSSPNLTQLRQRISILCRLEPLAREEIVGYIEHRLRLAGYAGPPLFTPRALETILGHSEGIPRNINNLCFNALLAGYAAGRKQIDSAIVDQVLADLEMDPLKAKNAVTQQETPTPQRTPIILDPGMFEVNLDRKQADSKDIEEIVIEFDVTPPDLVAQAAQPQAPPSPPKSPLPCAEVSRRVYSEQKQVDLSKAPEAVFHFDLDPPVRKPQVAEPLAPPRKAQSDPSKSRSDFSERTQVASTMVDNIVAHSGVISSAQKTCQPVRLATPAPQRVPVVSYPEISRESLRRKTMGALTLGIAVLLAGLLLFYYKVGASRQSHDPLAAAAAPVVSPLPSPPVSSPLAAGSTPAGSLPAMDAARAQSFLTRMLEAKIVRIVIDPGHGGHDPGTTGPTGLTEKDLCLDVALRLGRIIKQRLANAEVVFTRTNDAFISLEERTYIANDIKADLFLSIHANSSPYPAVRGIETYYLDFVGSTEVMEVAARENATAQEKVSDRFELMKKIGLGEKKMEESRMFAEDIQDSLSRLIQRSASSAQNRRVGRAPFVVLAGANMPSVLTEISFLSNPSDEQLLRKSQYRERLAEGLYQGVATYLQSQNSFTHNPPARGPAVVPSGFSPISVDPGIARRASHSAESVKPVIAGDDFALFDQAVYVRKRRGLSLIVYRKTIG